MYIVINKTTNSEIIIEGCWPDEELLEMVKNGEEVIVYSTYSETVKIISLGEPDYYGEPQLDDKIVEFKLPIDLLNTFRRDRYTGKLINKGV